METGTDKSSLQEQEPNHAGGGEKMFKYEMVNLPKIAIIGKEGLCTKEKNVVQDLWQQANSNFSDTLPKPCWLSTWTSCGGSPPSGRNA